MAECPRCCVRQWSRVSETRAAWVVVEGGAGRRWQGQISVLPRCALDLAQPGKMAREGQPGLECVLKVSVIVEETTHLMKCTTHSGECRKCISAA